MGTLCMTIHQELISSYDTAGLSHDHKSLCNSLANLPNKSKVGLRVRLCRMDQSLRLPQDPGLLYSNPKVSWAHAGVGVIMKGTDPRCHHTSQKPQQGLLIRSGDKSHNRNVYSGAYHVVMYFYHDKSQLCVFRVHFCVLATSHNHLVNNFLSLVTISSHKSRSLRL